MRSPEAPQSSSSPSAPSEVRRGHDLRALVELTESLATRHDIHEILFLVVSRLAELLHVDRGSIVLFSDGEEDERGTVVATSDDVGVRNLRLDLEKYPELRQVQASAATIIIDDVSQSPILREVLHEEGPLEFASMALVPIVGAAGPIAVLCLKGRSRVKFSEHDLMEARAVANATAISLNNARILKTLRSESSARSAKDQARLNELNRYFDFFESSADAMLVMDDQGRILFANPTAELLTGIPQSSLVQLGFTELVAPRDRQLAGEIVRGFGTRDYPVGIDFHLASSDPENRIACVNFSGVLHENDAVLATMRDVTRERELARELAHTKEFLERVIDSSVDSIVSADLRGNVLLFNGAAAKLFGYERDEVVGKISVEALYPNRCAREVMQRIRGSEYGGRGRLEDFRVDMLTKSGERIPVILSASLVLEEGVPVATLGIFTDVREKLAMEARLARAQQELQTHEKQSAIAALAGAAAHELNQPLTSVMGYAEYLKRIIGADPQLGRAVDVIQSETERMAEIVRKVGRITRYETKPYIGESRIVDLDKSSTPEE